MNPADCRMLTVIQTAFPLERRPYRTLASALGEPEADLFRKVRAFRRDGVIERLGPVFDPPRMGRKPALAAASVPPDCFRHVVETINQCPFVTQIYRVDHILNLWFAWSGGSGLEMERRMDDLRRLTGVSLMFALPETTTFKRQFFAAINAGSDGPEAAARMRQPCRSGTPARLSDDQKRLVRFLQDDLPVDPRPYDAVSAASGLPVERILGQLEAWLEGGVIDRIGAVLVPRRVGYPAGALVVMQVPADAVESSGRLAADAAFATHVCARPPHDDWPYNLYVLLHGRTRKQVYAMALKLSAACGASGFEVLFATEEYKNTPMRFVPESDACCIADSGDEPQDGGG